MRLKFNSLSLLSQRLIDTAQTLFAKLALFGFLLSFDKIIESALNRTYYKDRDLFYTEIVSYITCD